FLRNRDLPNPSRQPDTLRLVTRVLGLPLTGLLLQQAAGWRSHFATGSKSFKGAHLVLQMRSQVLDEPLEDIFRDWHPDFRTKPHKTRSSRRLKQPDFYALQSRPQELTSIILRRVCRMVRKVAD